MGYREAVLVKLPGDSPRIGDVVCFVVPGGEYQVLDVRDWGSGEWVIREARFQSRRTAHRIIGFNATLENWTVEYYLTRGDNNMKPDPFIPPKDGLPFERIAPAYGVKPEWIDSRVVLAVPVNPLLAWLLWAVVASFHLCRRRVMLMVRKLRRVFISP